MTDRQPLGRPLAANQIWSMDIVFDRTAEGRVIKCLTVVDDATHEPVAIVPERAIGGLRLTRILNRLALRRGLPKAIRTNNGKEFCGKPRQEVMIHSDQGSQFSSSDWQSFLKANNLLGSMSRRGNCHDNAVAATSPLLQ